MKKLRNWSILAIFSICCCIVIAACGMGKSREADKLYINHGLLFEILLNDDCTVDAKKEGIVTVVLPDEESKITVRVFPGVQDARLTAQKYNELTRSADQNQEAKITDISESSLAGIAGWEFESAWIDKTKKEKEGIPYTKKEMFVIANQSLYQVSTVKQQDASEEDSEMLDKMIASLAILVPQIVDEGTKTAVYAEKHKEKKIAETSVSKEYADNLTALPYAYYGEWWSKEICQLEGMDIYVSEYLTSPVFSYQERAEFWCWGWDESGKWDFYNDNSGLYQLFALNEAAKGEKEITDKVSQIWDFKESKVTEAANRELYQDALTQVQALPEGEVRNTLTDALNKVNDALTQKEKEEAEAKAKKEAEAKAKAEAEAKAAADAAAQQQYSDPGDYYDYGDQGDPGDYYDYGDQGDPGDYYDYGDQGDPGDYYDYGDQGDPGDYYDYWY